MELASEIGSQLRRLLALYMEMFAVQASCDWNELTCMTLSEAFVLIRSGKREVDKDSEILLNSRSSPGDKLCLDIRDAERFSTKEFLADHDSTRSERCRVNFGFGIGGCLGSLGVLASLGFGGGGGGGGGSRWSGLLQLVIGALRAGGGGLRHDGFSTRGGEGGNTTRNLLRSDRTQQMLIFTTGPADAGNLSTSESSRSADKKDRRSLSRSVERAWAKERASLRRETSYTNGQTERRQVIEERRKRKTEIEGDEMFIYPARELIGRA